MDSLETAKIFKSLSEGLRLRLLRLLSEEELNGNELRSILEVPQSTLSRHLTILKDAGLLEARRQGSWTYYRLGSPKELNGRGDTLIALVRDLTASDEAIELDRVRLDEVLHERRRAVREHFERSGHTWDEFHRRNADHSAKLRAFCHLVPEDLLIVDAGCGSGYLLPELAGLSARVVAVDNAPNQLRKARDRVASAELEGIEFREGELTALPVADGEADAVFAHLSLHHVAQPEAALRDMFRALKPGGSLVVTDFNAHEETWLRDEHADLWLGFDPDEVERWFLRAGFVDVEKREQPYARSLESEHPRLTAGLSLFIMRGRVPRKTERTPTP